MKRKKGARSKKKKKGKESKKKNMRKEKNRATPNIRSRPKCREQYCSLSSFPQLPPSVPGKRFPVLVSEVCLFIF